MNLLPRNATLIIIDVQQGFDEPVWGQRNNPQAEENIARLLAAWRRTQRPIIHVQHLSGEPDSTLRPNHPGSAIKPIVQPLPGEPVIQKSVNSAFIGTDLEARLRQNDLLPSSSSGLPPTIASQPPRAWRATSASIRILSPMPPLPSSATAMTAGTTAPTRSTPFPWSALMASSPPSSRLILYSNISSPRKLMC